MIAEQHTGLVAVAATLVNVDWDEGLASRALDRRRTQPPPIQRPRRALKATYSW